MEEIERNQLIAKLISDGMSLSDVQKALKDEYNIQMTYMELRLISSDLDVNWEKCDAKAAAAKPKVIDPNDTVDDGGLGGTQVNVNKVVRPGAVMSGDVTFASGARADWQIDPMGRLALNPIGDSGKPTEADLQEFQMELQRILQGAR